MATIYVIVVFKYFKYLKSDVYILYILNSWHILQIPIGNR